MVEFLSAVLMYNLIFATLYLVCVVIYKAINIWGGHMKSSDIFVVEKNELIFWLVIQLIFGVTISPILLGFFQQPGVENTFTDLADSFRQASGEHLGGFIAICIITSVVCGICTLVVSIEAGGDEWLRATKCIWQCGLFMVLLIECCIIVVCLRSVSDDIKIEDYEKLSKLVSKYPLLKKFLINDGGIIKPIQRDIVIKQFNMMEEITKANIPNTFEFIEDGNVTDAEYSKFTMIKQKYLKNELTGSEGN